MSSDLPTQAEQETLKDPTAWNIVHLEDHKLMWARMEKCLRKKFPHVIIKAFENGDTALEYVKFALENDISLDLIMTDVNHPGLKGREFCRAVRELEGAYGRIIPLLILSMYYSEERRREMELLPRLRFLSKTHSGEQINETIHQLLHSPY